MEPSAKASPSADKRSHGLVLIVEDDPASAAALSRILTHVGWRVTDVPTVREALEFLAQPVDVLVLDLMLPDGDGLEVLNRLRKVQPDCRVAITTGASDPEHLKKAVDLQPGLLLHKPIDLQKLLKFLGTPMQ